MPYRAGIIAFSLILPVFLSAAIAAAQTE